MHLLLPALELLAFRRYLGRLLLGLGPAFRQLLLLRLQRRAPLPQCRPLPLDPRAPLLKPAAQTIPLPFELVPLLAQPGSVHDELSSQRIELCALRGQLLLIRPGLGPRGGTGFLLQAARFLLHRVLALLKFLLPRRESR